ncbi:MAG: FecR domain-containing protein [Verrucomicrobia bacterium]|nr:FecR domain-containing protein [Verrucomicrobiota bacterium]
MVWHKASPPTVVTERAFAPSAVVALPERQVLSDGSIVELRSGAQLEVAFTDLIRRVVLTRGEAHFQVVKMAQPFVVAVGGVEVRAVGTAFSVQLGSAQVEVMVTEGSVAVVQGTGSNDQGAEAAGIRTEEPGPPSSVLRPPSSALLVEAGNRVVVPTDATARSSPEVVPVESAELAARLAWRVQRLEFSRTPLVEALAMMNQHAAPGKSVTVVLADPALGNVQVSGVLRADNIETLLHLLEDEHGIKAEYRSPHEVVLRRGR